MSDAKRKLVEVIISRMAAHPEQFSCESWYLHDNEAGTRYYIGGGPGRARIAKPFELYFGWRNGRRFLRAVEDWKVASALEKVRLAQHPE